MLGMGINPWELEGGRAERFREKHGLIGPIVCYIGPKTYDKGTFHLVQAMESLWRSGDPSTLVLAGTDIEDFRRYHEKLPERVKSKCLMLDYVTDDEKRDLLDACDLLALPSRSDSFGIVFLEAWFYGKPVVGARAGGIPGLVRDGVDGLLVPFGDVKELALAIKELLDGPGVRAAGSVPPAAERVLSEFTWDEKYAVVRDALRGADRGGRAVPDKGIDVEQVMEEVNRAVARPTPLLADFWKEEGPQSPNLAFIYPPYSKTLQVNLDLVSRNWEIDSEFELGSAAQALPRLVVVFKKTIRRTPALVHQPDRPPGAQVQHAGHAHAIRHRQQPRGAGEGAWLAGSRRRAVTQAERRDGTGRRRRDDEPTPGPVSRHRAHLERPRGHHEGASTPARRHATTPTSRWWSSTTAAPTAHSSTCAGSTGSGSSRTARTWGSWRATTPGSRATTTDVVLLNNDTEVIAARTGSRACRSCAYSADDIGVVGLQAGQRGGAPGPRGHLHAGAELLGPGVPGGRARHRAVHARPRGRGRHRRLRLHQARGHRRESARSTRITSPTYEDTDYCLKARAAGYRVFCCGGATVRHLENASTDLNRMDFSGTFRRSREVFLSKWKGHYDDRYTRRLTWHSFISGTGAYRAAERAGAVGARPRRGGRQPRLPRGRRARPSSTTSASTT